MDGRYEPIHQLWYFLEVWWKMIAYINRLFAEATAELRNIRHGNVVQRPNSIFVKCGMALLDANLNTVGQQVVLPEKVLFVHEFVKLTIIAFEDNH